MLIIKRRVWRNYCWKRRIKLGFIEEKSINFRIKRQEYDFRLSQLPKIKRSLRFEIWNSLTIQIKRKL